MGMTGQTLSAGSHASAHSVGLKGPQGPQIPFHSGVKPRRNLGLFVVKRTHLESLLLLPQGYDLRYCLLTCLLLLRDRNGVGLLPPPDPQPDTALGHPDSGRKGYAWASPRFCPRRDGDAPWGFGDTRRGPSPTQRRLHPSPSGPAWAAEG